MRGLIGRLLQIQGAVVLCLLGLGWLLSYAVRSKELRKRCRRGAYQYVNALQQCLEAITAILKGSASTTLLHAGNVHHVQQVMSI